MSNLLEKTIVNRAIKYTSKKTLLYFFILVPHISYSTVKKIIQKSGLSLNLRLNGIDIDFFNNLILFFENECVDYHTLRSTVIENIKMQNALNTYKSKRRRLKYPVNGQRTRSNARTAFNRL